MPKTFSVTKGSSGSGPGSLTVQKDDSTVDSAATTLDFNDTDNSGFVTSSPAGEANVALTGYALLGGRSGGQSLKGGTTSSQNLTLYANTSAFADTNTGRIKLGERVVFDTAITPSTTLNDAVIKLTSVITTAQGANLFSGFQATHQIKYSVNQVLSLAPAFWAAAQMIPTVNGLSDTLTNFCGFLATNSYYPDVGGGNSATTPLLAGYVSGPIARVTSGSGTVTQIAGFKTYGTAFFSQDIDTGITVGTLSHFLTQTPELFSTANVTNHIGYDCASLEAVATLTAAFRSRQTPATNVYAFRDDGGAESTFRGRLTLGSGINLMTWDDNPMFYQDDAVVYATEW